MKSYRMLPFVIFAVSSLSFGGEPTDTLPNPNYPGPRPPSSPSHPIPINLHQHNKDIAYASAILVTQNRSTPSEWKSIYRKSAASSPGYPRPGMPPQKPTSTDVAAVEVNYGEVYFVTQYNVQECEDGRTIVVRSGVSVNLTSATQGVISQFQEVFTCPEAPRPIPFPIPLPPPFPTDPSPAINTADPDRPLDWSSITKSN